HLHQQVRGLRSLLARATARPPARKARMQGGVGLLELRLEARVQPLQAARTIQIVEAEPLEAKGERMMSVLGILRQVAHWVGEPTGPARPLISRAAREQAREKGVRKW